MRKKLCWILCSVGLWVACVDAAVVPLPEAQKVTSTVSSTQAHYGWSVNYPKQRKMFFIHKKLWVFYSDGSNAVYRTSDDGKTWSQPTLVKVNGHYGHRTGFSFDGTYLHYAHNAAAAGESVVYRRGKPNSSGKIQWSAEQTVATVSTQHNVMYPKVIVDDKGYPWISYVLCKGGPHNAPYDAIVIKSSKNDGTWATAQNFPHILVANNPDSYPDVTGTPMLQGKTYWMVNQKKGEPYRGKLWNGSSWEKEENVSLGGGAYGLFNLIAEGDTVHAVYLTRGAQYRKRDPKTGWGKEQLVMHSAGGHLSLTQVGSQHLLVTWLDKHSQHVMMREVKNNQWGQPTLIADESSMGLSGSETTKGINLNTLLTATPTLQTAITYTVGTRAPFQLRFVGIKKP